MVQITAGYCDSRWFGIAWSGEDLVATACESTREKAIKSVTRCVPRDITAQVVFTPTEYAADMIKLLGELERGKEERKSYSLSPFLSGPQRRILTAAAAIPIGYVSTYGNIADAAGSEARAVGRAMATNPLYPIVPCHRVVGADMSLVGYGGRQDAQALAAKLGRLKKEAREVQHNMEIEVSSGILLVIPVERVLEAALAADRRKRDAAKRKAELIAADRRQLRLF